MTTAMPATIRAPLAVPEVSTADLQAFYEAHFSANAVANFRSEFFSTNGNEAAVRDADFREEDGIEDDDDGLGYYDDGTKRTLTDEQIAMFRHSELRALRLEKRAQSTPKSDNLDPGEIEDEGSVLHDEVSGQSKASHAATSKNKKKKKGSKNKRFEPKPDLRKRTWDVVDTGLDSLDYDEMEGGQSNRTASQNQRQQISYDD